MITVHPHPPLDVAGLSTYFSECLTQCGSEHADGVRISLDGAVRLWIEGRALEPSDPVCPEDADPECVAMALAMLGEGDVATEIRPDGRIVVPLTGSGRGPGSARMASCAGGGHAGEAGVCLYLELLDRIPEETPRRLACFGLALELVGATQIARVGLVVPPAGHAPALVALLALAVGFDLSSGVAELGVVASQEPLFRRVAGSDFLAGQWLQIHAGQLQMKQS